MLIEAYQGGGGQLEEGVRGGMLRERQRLGLWGVKRLGLGEGGRRIVERDQRPYRGEGGARLLK